MSAVIQTTDLTKRYGSQTSVDRLTMTVRQGEMALFTKAGFWKN
ncbi:hypothetical protein [Paenibacillus oceani]|nr:hypothetical protein [Paenibacillus oceani]